MDMDGGTVVDERTDGGTVVDERKKTSEEDEDDKSKFTFLQACAFNTMMMFGTGPFISVPFCLAAPAPPGPQAMIGYGLAAIACQADSLIWGELGSRYPFSGGTYHFLKECFGAETWGQLAAFIYVWQFWVSGPAEVASGFIAISEYLVYIHGDASDLTKAWTAIGLLAFTVAVLSRRNAELGACVYALWAVTIGAILFTLVAGFSNFNPEHFNLPDKPFGTGGSAFIISLGASMRFGVYDFTGYYDVCQMGGEVRQPRKTIPRSCILTCAVMLCVYLLVYVAIVSLRRVPTPFCVHRRAQRVCVYVCVAPTSLHRVVLCGRSGSCRGTAPTASSRRWRRRRTRRPTSWARSPRRCGVAPSASSSPSSWSSPSTAPSCRCSPA